MNNHQVRSHLSLFVIFNVLISALNANMVLAQPLCYLIDANGNRVNLSGICGKSPQAAVIREKTPPASEKTPTPVDNNSGNSQPPQNNQANPENVQQSDNPNSGNNNPNTVNSTNTEKEEIDTSKFPPAQRTIPLLQNQKKEQVTNNQ